MAGSCSVYSSNSRLSLALIQTLASVRSSIFTCVSYTFPLLRDCHASTSTTPGPGYTIFFYSCASANAMILSAHQCRKVAALSIYRVQQAGSTSAGKRGERAIPHVGVELQGPHSHSTSRALLVPEPRRSLGSAPLYCDRLAWVERKFVSDCRRKPTTPLA